MPTATSSVTRIEVRRKPDAGDPHADAITRDAQARGIALDSARTSRVYLIEGDLDDAQIERIRADLLTNPVVEHATLGAHPADGSILEVHPLPGVMDPAAQSVANAIEELVGVRARVATGWRYDFNGASHATLDTLARTLANPVVHAVHREPHHPSELPRSVTRTHDVQHIPVRNLTDDELTRLSRDAHLFLDLHEMQAIRDYYRALEREPADIELETLAQTWSEHCVHKTLKSIVRYTSDTTNPQLDSQEQDPITWSGRPGHTPNPDGSITINNLLKSTVAAATHELMAEDPEGLGRWCLSVFKDNAGIVAFDDDHAVCIKVETHNHPSAIEPYGGAATGIGGCIRDVIGTGLAAKPIANTDVFCVANPDLEDVPTGCLHPRRILTQIVAGVRDYGNRMGIPTLNGAVYFDDRYVGNPLVFCGSIGIMPRGDNDSMISGEAKPGDLIVALGGRTGRDGIHGATFSSAELTDTHADEFSHAVQIGNAIEEKRVLDAILRARDFTDPAEASDKPQPSERAPLFHAITDCGAGGFSSAVGEMGAEIGAEVHLDRAPLKYPGLTYTEIWISEAQERMVLAVPPANLDALQKICDEEHVELAVLGTFGTPNADLILNYHGTEVGRLSMAFLHDGIPTPTREAVWSGTGTEARRHGGTKGETPAIPPALDSKALRASLPECLRALLAHPNIASKHWIIRQYDHEVQGNTLIKPLVGPAGRGPSDAAVIEPVPGSKRGIAIASGLATPLGDPALGGDPYQMALAAIDECVRNLVCVGADPSRIAILDNFCWPRCAKPENLASLVRAAEGCYDAAKAYRTPFVSGKDSLNNQFTTKDGRTIEIPPTLLITGLSIIEDTSKCVTMDLKQTGNNLYVVEAGQDLDNLLRMGGSHYRAMFGAQATDDPSHAPEMPQVDLDEGPRQARTIAEAIRREYVASCHDSSDGGPIVAVAEMLIAGHAQDHPLGVRWGDCNPPARLWSERPSCYVVEVHAEHERAFVELMGELGGGWTRLAEVTDSGSLELYGNNEEHIPVEDLARAWRGTLDW